MSLRLYYSASCAYCKNFCQQLAALPELNKQFRFINVATTNTGVTSVPTLVVNSQAFVGRDAFLWLQQQAQAAAGPTCYDLSDQSGLVFTAIGDDGTTSRTQPFCHL